MTFGRERNQELVISGEKSGLEIEGRTSRLSGSISSKGSGNRIIFPERELTGNVNIAINDGDTTIDLSGLAKFKSIKIISAQSGGIQIGQGTTMVNANFVADAADITLGSDCMLSFGIVLRNTDAHSIFDIESGDRINQPQRILIESHVWLGQEVMIGKGSRIGRGSIIGARSYVTKGDIPANSLAVGTPAKVLRTGVIWDRFSAANMYEETERLHPMLQKNMTIWTT